MRILVIEDEARLAQTLAELLHRQGYTVDISGDGLSGLDNAASDIYDLVVLGAMLPGMDGFTLLQRLRQEGHTVPVLMLTARSEEFDELMGFEAGADDYVTKPFSPSVLMKRVAALLRRAQAPDAGDSMHMDELCINEEAHEVTLHGKPLELTLKEYNLLRKLMASPGRVYTREQLLDSIWGIDYVGDIRTVDSHMARLRTKLGEWGGAHLKTVYGMGYKIEGQI